MSQTFPEQTDAQPAQPKNAWGQALQSWMEQSQQIVLKWLYEIGGWIFTGLIAVALMILQNLFIIGRLDRGLSFAALTLAAALPLNLAGMWIVRYLKNRDQAQANLAAAPTKKAAAASPTASAPIFSDKQRGFTNGILSILFGLSVLLTLLGVVFTFWHISGAVSLVFLIVFLVGLFVTFWVLAYRG